MSKTRGDPRRDVLAEVDSAPGEVEAFRRDCRIAGTLVGQGVGDALGVAYEGGRAPAMGQARMLGGGFGRYEPGTWSDDTECAVMVAEAKAEPLEVAANLLRWYSSRPPDIGPTSSAVLGRARSPQEVPELARQAARGRVPGEVSNGSLMRTAPVALAHLRDHARIAEVAREVSDLTHCDEFAADACALWCIAIDRAIELGGKFHMADAMHDALKFVPEARRDTWASLIDDVLASPDGRGLRLRHNWSCVGAFRAALFAVSHSKTFSQGVQLAVSLGGDTDTVAAIAGSLLGSWHGLLEIPTPWYRKVHGWPGMNGRDLGRLALVTAGRARARAEWAGPEAEYHPCTTGGRHWGPRGAAGMVPVAEVGGQPWVLLSHRSPHVQQGDCWSCLGGAIEEGEDALAAALREAREEVTGLPPDGRVVAQLEAPCAAGCGWSYTTFAYQLEVYGDKLPEVKVRGPHAWETTEARWVPVGEVHDMDLHPGFRQGWPELAAKLAEGTS